MPENVGKNRKILKREVKDFDKTIRRTSSKIPRPSTPINKNIEDQVLACVGEDEVATKNEGDSSFLQLYITKVYLIQDALNKKKVSVSSENPNLNHNVIELAEKITKLCHKINDVESHMYIGSKNANPKIEFGPGGDIDIIESTGSKYLGKIFENNYFHKKDDKYATSEKSTKNALNATTSQLFSPSEFSISNMFTTTNLEKSNSFSPEVKTNRKPVIQEIQTRSTNTNVDANDEKVSKTLNTLVTKTDDIMGRISLIDLNVKELHTFNEASQTNEICEYCKLFSDELSNQKQQIKQIVDTLQEFIEQFSNINNYQDEFSKLSSTMQNVLQNTEDICVNINASKNSSNQNSVLLNKHKILKKNYSELISGSNLQYCFESDYFPQLNQKQFEEIEKIQTDTDFCFVDKERYRLFKKFLKRNKKPLRKLKRKKCLPNEIGDGSKIPQNKNSNEQINKLFSNISDNLMKSKLKCKSDKINNLGNIKKKDDKNLIKKVYSMYSISSKKSKISNKNKNLTKNNSSDKNNLNSRSFRNLNISESLKLNEDCRITENEDQLNISDTPSEKIIWNNQMKNSQKILHGIIHKKTKSDQIINDNVDENVISSEKYAEIVMELNTIITKKAQDKIKVFPNECKSKTMPIKKNCTDENLEKTISLNTKDVKSYVEINSNKNMCFTDKYKIKKCKLKKSIFSFKKNSKVSSKCIQVPSNTIDNYQEYLIQSFPDDNLCKCTQIDNLNETTTDLSEKACLCRLCGCRTNNTFNLNSKSSVANYLCQLLNKSLKCNTPVNNSTNCVHVNVPFKDNIITQQENKEKHNNVNNKDMLQEIFIKKNVSSKSLMNNLLNDQSKNNSIVQDSLEFLDSSQISLHNIHKTFGNKKKLYKYFTKKKYVSDENSNSGIVEYNCQDNLNILKINENSPIFSSKSNTKVFEGATKSKTIPLKDSIKIIKNKHLTNLENSWNTDSSSSGKSYMEFAYPYKQNKNLDVLYSTVKEPSKLKSFAYESVSLFDQPQKESEIIKQKVELKDILNKDKKSSKKSIYTSSSLNENIKSNSPMKYTNSDIKKQLEKPKSSEYNKYILCISNKMSDIHKLETMGLNPIEVNKKILNSEKKFFSLSTKDVNLINKNQNKNDKNNEFIKSNFSKHKSFLATEFNTLLTEEADKIFDGRNNLEGLHTNHILGNLKPKNIKEFLSETSGEKDIDSKSEYITGQLNTTQQKTKRSFFKRLLGKGKK